jgi:hypothetical protein
MKNWITHYLTRQQIVREVVRGIVRAFNDFIAIFFLIKKPDFKSFWVNFEI